MSIVDSPISRTLIERVKNICVTPAAEWTVIDTERAETSTLLSGYVVPLAAVSAIAALIGRTVVGVTVPFVGTTYRVPIGSSIVLAVLSVVLAAVGVVVCAYIIDALAPTFGAQKNLMQATKVAVYAPTPAWAAGVLQILPMLGVLTLLGGLYSLYLLYLGLPKLMKCPEDKAVGYTVVVVVCAIVISLVIGSASALFVGNPLASGLVQ
jgi:hypothetical protein